MIPRIKFRRVRINVVGERIRIVCALQEIIIGVKLELPTTMKN